ncbi:MAG: hypothetical protein GX167_07915 [Firmicutes bacterium]|nr:hypothetical protein [Bacillota bacterium]
MKKIFALLCGVIIVLFATLVSAITRDPYLFYRINEWAFAILMLIVVILAIKVISIDPIVRRKKEILSLLSDTCNCDDEQEGRTEAVEQPRQLAQDKPSVDPKKEEKENIQAIKLLLLAALPPLLAELIRYYLF